MSITAFPLQWPAHWPRTASPKAAAFNTPFGAARSALLNELRLMRASNVIISSNLPLRRDGLPYATYGAGDDKGVAVYFDLDGSPQCIPCDKWSRVDDNLQAIRKTVEALRGLERWGAREMVRAAFRGFKALPETTITPPPTRQWFDVLGVAPTATGQEIRVAYRNLATIHHPDTGGDNEYFVELTKAYNEGMQHAKTN